MLTESRGDKAQRSSRQPTVHRGDYWLRARSGFDPMLVSLVTPHENSSRRYDDSDFRNRLEIFPPSHKDKI
jgi:hypothetical protein